MINKVSQRIRWLGHVNRMEPKRCTKTIRKWKPVETRRARDIWLEDLVEDLVEDLQSKLNRKWKRAADGRKGWRALVEGTNTHKGTKKEEEEN